VVVVLLAAMVLFVQVNKSVNLDNLDRKVSDVVHAAKFNKNAVEDLYENLRLLRAELTKLSADVPKLQADVAAIKAVPLKARHL
jgi:hypothetical protein